MLKKNYLTLCHILILYDIYFYTLNYNIIEQTKTVKSNIQITIHLTKVLLYKSVKRINISVNLSS